MADMHVLEGDEGKYRVVMHFPVPSGNNPVGTAWSTALVQSTGFKEDGTPATPTTVLRTITPAEKAQIEVGTVFEHVVEVEVDGSGQTNAGRRVLLRRTYVAAKTALTTEFRARFRFYGHTESEA